MSITIDLEIYSPRWGHNDTYTVELDNNYMEITMQARKARATQQQGKDPVWSGESLEGIMNNDNIYPPAITQDLFERAWEAWRNGELNSQEVESELKEIASWINEVTSSKPDTEFWSKYF